MKQLNEWLACSFHCCGLWAQQRPSTAAEFLSLISLFIQSIQFIILAFISSYAVAPQRRRAQPWKCLIKKRLIIERINKDWRGVGLSCLLWGLWASGPSCSGGIPFHQIFQFWWFKKIFYFEYIVISCVFLKYLQSGDMFEKYVLKNKN